MAPFQRMPAGRVVHGPRVGPGLSILEAIADALGARLDVVPRTGGGLEVTVAFGAAAAADAAPAVTSPAAWWAARILP